MWQWQSQTLVLLFGLDILEGLFKDLPLGLLNLSAAASSTGPPLCMTNVIAAFALVLGWYFLQQSSGITFLGLCTLCPNEVSIATPFHFYPHNHHHFVR